MRRAFLAALCLAALGPLRAGEVTIGDFEEGLPGWTFSSGPEFPGATGGLDRAHEAAFSGGHGARLRFDFRGGGAYVAMYYGFPEPVPLLRFRFRIRKPPEARVTVRVTDSTGQTVQKSRRHAHGDWQGLSVGMAGWTGHWGGANDGRVHQPVRALGILIESAGLRDRRGEAWIDDVVAVTGPAEGAPTRGIAVETEYRVADPGRPLPPSTTLLGHPLRLRVVLETDGSPGEVRLVCASHFQSFERIVPLPREPGEHAVDAGLPPEGWRHFGGENDGRLHGPIRLTGLEVRGPARGRAKLREVRAGTRVTARTAVAAFPGVTVEDDRARFSFDLKNTLARPVEVDVAVAVRRWDGLPAGEPAFFPARRRVGADATARLTLGVWDHFIRPGLGPYVHRRTGAPTFDLRAHPYAHATLRFRLRRADGAGLDLRHAPWQAVSIGAARLPLGPGDAGVKWSREEFQWHRIEPREGRFRWSFYDRMVETARRHGIRIYGLLAYWSGWTEPYTERGIEAYARWAAAVVRRYRDRIRHWEVWNEPNIFFWQGPRDLYAKLLAKAHAAIKREDPAAKVLGLSTAGIDTLFIRRMLELGAPFDILTIHPYRGTLDEASFMEELRRVKDLVGGRPVWITEMGWPTQLGGTDEAEQARLLARTYLASVCSGAVANVSWYDFREDGEDPLYNEHHFGVVRPDLAPKAAYLALAAVCRTIASRPLRGAIAKEEGLFAYAFGEGPAHVAAIWSIDRPRLVAVSSGAARVTIRNTVGEDARRMPRDGTALLALAPGSPVYVIADRPVTGCRTALSLHPDGAARAGGTLRVRWRLEGALREPLRLAWILPKGWAAEPGRIAIGPAASRGAFRLNLPADPGLEPPALEVRRGDWRGLLPLDVTVLPEWLEI